MPTPQISGTYGGAPVLDGRLQTAFVGAGVAAVLPVDLENDIVRLTFAAHPQHGVALESITHLEDQDGAGATFTWSNVAGPLWRLVTQPASGWSDGWSAAFGGGFAEVLPPADVSVTETVDADGRPAVMARWESVELPTLGSVDVTVLVSLGDSDRVARWLISVVRFGVEQDGIERVDFPLLRIRGPVATRSGLTHEQSQARAQVLLPASVMPDLLTVNAPLSQWAGRELRTAHPTGEVGITIQPLQFSALCGVDPQDTASERRILFLAASDLEGAHKEFLHAGETFGADMVYRWEHRYFPAWKEWAASDLQADASRFGNVFYAPYPVLVGLTEAPTAAWWHTAAALYREQVADRMATRPRGTDDRRSELARAMPLISATRQEIDQDGATVGVQFRTWANELRQIVGADVAVAQLDKLDPQVIPVPPSAVAHAAIRGTNYLPMCSWSHNLELAWQPMLNPDSNTRPIQATDGWYLERICRQELEQIAAVGCNNIRLWCSMIGHAMDPVGFRSVLQSIAGICADLGLTITVVLFSTTPAGYAAYSGTSAWGWLQSAGYSGTVLRAQQWLASDAWQLLCYEGNTAGAPWGLPTGEVDLTHSPTPATAAQWLTLGRFGQWSDTRFQDAVRRYVTDVVQFFAGPGAQVFQSYDVYNEADTLFLAAPATKPIVMDFCGQIWELIQRAHRGAACTVGWTVGGSTVRYSTELQQQYHFRIGYVSLHGYATDASGFATLVAYWGAGATEALALGVPLVLSEWIVLPENEEGVEVQAYIDTIAALGAGGQCWSILRNNAYRPPISPSTSARIFDGLITCRTPALQVTSQMYGSAWSDGWSDGWGSSPPRLQFDVAYPDDLAAITAWVQT